MVRRIIIRKKTQEIYKRTNTRPQGFFEVFVTKPKNTFSFKLPKNRRCDLDEGRKYF